MHIKRIIIEGFKSYKFKTEIELHKGHNIIVGKNGSGKSNIFSAIQFILCDKYSNLSAEERYRLIFEDSERQSLAAFVEIIFDNFDTRFPVNSNEVSIKRISGLKKDEYFLNGKHSTKSNIESMLESAGISRANSYFIVQQGKVNALIKMGEKERLSLLREIAGTKVYDEKRGESVRLLEESALKSAQIKEIIDRIENRVTELDEEKGDLRIYQEKNDERRSIEFLIYRKEVEKLTEDLSLLSSKHEKATERVDENHSKAEKIRQTIAEEKTALENLESGMQKIETERIRLLSLRRKQLKAISALANKTEQASSVVSSCGKLCKDLIAESKSIQDRLDQEKDKIEAAEKSLADCLKEKTQIEPLVEQYRNRLEILQAKCGRNDAFATKAERDKFLWEQIKSKQAMIDFNYDKIREMKRRLAELTGSLMIGKETERDELENGIKETESKLVEMENKYLFALKKRNEYTVERKKLWGQVSEIRKNKGNLLDEKRAIENDLRFTMSKEQHNAIRQIQQIARDKKIKGYYGYIGELFEVKNPKFYKCVEKVAGNRLFFHVVENDSIAVEILNEMNRLNMARVTIMPLNQLSNFEGKKVKLNSDALEMIDQLQFDKNFEKAMFQIFGKTLIARSLEIAADFAQKCNKDAITLDGDRAFRKGSLSGGYSENRFSRIKLIRSLKELVKKISKYDMDEEENDKKTKQIDERLTQVVSDLNIFESEKHHLLRLLQCTKNSLYLIEKEIRSDRDEALKYQKTGKILEHSITQHEAAIKDLNSERNADFFTRLGEEEVREMKALQKLLDEKDRELETIDARVFELDIAKRKSENLVKFNLEHQKRECSENFNENDCKLKSTELILKRAEMELREYRELLSDTEGSLKQIQKERKNKTAGRGKLKARVSSDAELEAKLKAELAELQGKKELIEKRRDAVSAKKEEMGEKTQALGFVEKALYEKNEKKTINELILLRKKINEQLKSFPPVNRKALDQYMSFSRQRSDLLGRKKEQDKGESAIRELIEHLDRRKDEAINRTFNSIAEHFGAVFRELVPNGKASLRIIREQRAGESQSGLGGDGKRDAENGLAIPVESFVGVAIEVSFEKKAAWPSNLEALSGGQQTLVALSLIFAIQRCDPAPFYFLDEIDANLDSTHRAAVAAMLAKLSAIPMQIVSTTFKPEPLSSADRCFVVSFDEKVSAVSEASLQQAMEVIKSADR